MLINAGTIVFAGWNKEDAVAFIKREGYTRDDVRMVESVDGQILVSLRGEYNYVTQKERTA